MVPAAGIATYCATKHAVLGYTETVRMENRGRGVHFSAIMPTLTNTEMIAGFGHARGFKNAEPDDVARAVVGVIAKPKPRVFVPRSMGIAISAQRLMPQRVSEAMGRAMGTGRVFTSDSEPTSAALMPGARGHPEFVSGVFHADVKIIAPQVISDKVISNSYSAAGADLIA